MSNIDNQTTLLIRVDGNSAQLTYQAYVPHDWDELQCQASIGIDYDEKVYSIAPAYAGTGAYSYQAATPSYPQLLSNNIFAVTSNIIPISNLQQPLAVCSADNKFSPIFYHSNKADTKVAGNYSLTVRNMYDQTTITLGYVFLILRFIKYKEK